MTATIYTIENLRARRTLLDSIERDEAAKRERSQRLHDLLDRRAAELLGDDLPPGGHAA